ncbi:MAG: hypothetical protein U1E51_31015 [Candidatus Binatia bacterium]|nr:hypothetical protein [Candidatus Binatia bacterium]
MVFQAAKWKRETDQRRDIELAWRTAALTRMKRMPSLKELFDPPRTRALSEQEAREKKRELEELKAIIEAKRKKQRGG